MSDSWEIGISICTRLYIKQVTNKNLPRSTGYFYSAFSTVYTRKESFKKQTCVHAQLIHSAVKLKLTITL